MITRKQRKAKWGKGPLCTICKKRRCKQAETMCWVCKWYVRRVRRKNK